MTRYESYFMIKESNVRIPIINASTNPIFNAAAAWIKKETGMKARPASVSYAGR